MADEVLVLNQDYQPLNVTNVQRAIALLCLGKVHTVRTDSKVYHSERITLELPAVVRLNYYVRRPMPDLRPSRRSIFTRDNSTCQYCGRDKVPLTIDHVTPRDRGGGTGWSNLVCCCTKCNNKKANRTPQEAGMRLLRQPRRPKYVPYIAYPKFVAAARNPRWRDYLEPYGDGISH